MQWHKPFFIREERLPNVPTTEQVNTIIPTFTRKYTTIFSILRDTGLRPVELHRLRLKNINLENGTITPKTAKNGTARILKLPNPTLAMLKEYLTKYNFKQTDVLFPPTKKQCHIWVLRRNQLAKKLNQPELTKYRLYDLRHYYATMLYDKTKDILLVKQQLGHKRIEHTLIYTHLVNFATDDFTCRCAKTLQEATMLVEAGFEYVTEMDSVKLFRKRK